MADKSAEKERLFNEWFTKSYDRLRGNEQRIEKGKTFASHHKAVGHPQEEKAHTDWQRVGKSRLKRFFLHIPPQLQRRDTLREFLSD